MCFLRTSRDRRGTFIRRSIGFKATRFRKRMQTQTIMVVGGSGFIGQHVAAALSASGHKVYATHGAGRPVPSISAVTWVPCDLCSSTATDVWPKDCQAVMFLAQAREHREFP